MDLSTGLSRAGKAIHWLGIAWAALWVFLAFTVGAKDEAIPMYLLMAAVGYAISAGIAWIVRGFAGR